MTEPDSLPPDALQSAPLSDRRQFHIHTCLGRGGFGEVYRATMSSAGGVRTDVAVKVLHAEVEPGSQAVRRLRDEGRLLGAVRHPSVLRVYDLVLLEGRVALVTEYVEGQDLDKCVAARPPMPLRGLIEVIGRVAEALDAAFTASSPFGEGQLRLVHRDIKPANIRIGRHGEVKLLDFGIARATNVRREARTETNALLGSFLYMAPERFLEDEDLGPAIDTFGLGCTLYEGMSSERLFGELKLKDLYLLILNEEKFSRFVAQRLERLEDHTPPAVMRLLASMLEMDPARRPAHAELAQTCYDIMETLPGDPLSRWARRRRWPEARSVPGILNNTTITEASFLDGSTTSAPLSLPQPSEETVEGALSRIRTNTFEHPGVVVGVGAGLVGVAAIAGVALVLLLAGGTGLWWWLQRDELPDVLMGVPTVEPLPGDPEPVLADPEQPVPSDPASAPPEPGEATPEPVEPAPVPRPTAPRSRPPAAAEPAPAPKPPPVPVRAPAPPRAAPAAQEPSVVRLEGGVVVSLRGANGTHRVGRVPPGTYEVHARFDDAYVKTTTLHALPGQQHLIKCSKLLQSCEVVR